MSPYDQCRLKPGHCLIDSRTGLIWIVLALERKEKLVTVVVNRSNVFTQNDFDSLTIVEPGTPDAPPAAAAAEPDAWMRVRYTHDEDGMPADPVESEFSAGPTQPDGLGWEALFLGSPPTARAPEHPPGTVTDEMVERYLALEAALRPAATDAEAGKQKQGGYDHPYWRDEKPFE